MIVTRFTRLLQHLLIFCLSVDYAQQTKILLSALNAVHEYDSDSGKITHLVNMTNPVFSIDYDSSGFVYCSSPMPVSNSIQRFRYPSENYITQTVVSSPSQAVMDMVVDPVSSHLYWVEYPNGRIKRSELNGTNVITVISLNYISTIDIDIPNRWMYFGMCTTGSVCRIQRSRLDGQDIQMLVNFTADEPPTNLRKDGERLYWMEMGYGNIKIIQSSALNGSDVRQRFKSYTTASVNFFDIYGSYIYLANNTQIVRINTLFEDEYTVLYNSTTPIAVTRVYQQGEDNGTCSYKIDALEKKIQELTLNYTNILNQLPPTVSCQSPYQKIRDGCYLISDIIGSGDDAFARCTNLGAYLANFETLEEAMAMKLFLQQMNSGVHYFVGGRNINRYLPSGDWRWIKNGNATKMTYFAFANGQPGGTAIDEQDCMLFYANDRFKFYDVSCDHSNSQGGYICEIQRN